VPPKDRDHGPWPTSVWARSGRPGEDPARGARARRRRLRRLGGLVLGPCAGSAPPSSRPLAALPRGSGSRPGHSNPPGVVAHRPGPPRANKRNRIGPEWRLGQRGRRPPLHRDRARGLGDRSWRRPVPGRRVERQHRFRGVLGGSPDAYREVGVDLGGVGGTRIARRGSDRGAVRGSQHSHAGVVDPRRRPACSLTGPPGGMAATPRPVAAGHSVLSPL
jgi:hypothetical protein